MSSEPKRLNGAALDLYFEDEMAYEERMARKLLTPEEREEIKAMMRPTIRPEEPHKLICFGTGSKP